MRKTPENSHIPTITDLVVAGDPVKKAQAKVLDASSSYLEELNQRIDDIENAIGQDNAGPVGRAFAIRAEKNKETDAKTSFMIEDDL